MYKVVNKALNALRSPEGKTIDFKKNFIQTESGREELIQVANALGIGLVMTTDKNNIDWVKLQSRVRQALSINWVAKPTLKTKLPSDPSIGLDIAQETRQTTNSDKFYENYASVNMGLFRLMPGDSQDIVDDELILQQLIDSGYSSRIQIFNSDNEILYDGGEADTENKVIAIDFKGNRYETVEKGKRSCNLLHPKLENKPFLKSKAAKAN